MALVMERRERTEPAEVVDLVWVGGFLDARGSLMTKGIPRLIIRHEDEDIARRIARLTGGTLKGPKRDQFPDRDKPGAPYWLVTLFNYESLKNLFDRIKPYISEARYNEVTAALAGYDPPNAKKVEFSQETCGYYDVIRPNASGYVAHKRRGDEPCRLCTECQRAYYRQMRSRRAE